MTAFHQRWVHSFNTAAPGHVVEERWDGRKWCQEGARKVPGRWGGHMLFPLDIGVERPELRPDNVVHMGWAKKG